MLSGWHFPWAVDATVCIHFQYDDPLSCRRLFINVWQRIKEMSQFSLQFL